MQTSVEAPPSVSIWHSWLSWLRSEWWRTDAEETDPPATSSMRVTPDSCLLNQLSRFFWRLTA